MRHIRLRILVVALATLAMTAMVSSAHANSTMDYVSITHDAQLAPMVIISNATTDDEGTQANFAGSALTGTGTTFDSMDLWAWFDVNKREGFAYMTDNSTTGGMMAASNGPQNECGANLAMDPTTRTTTFNLAHLDTGPPLTLSTQMAAIWHDGHNSARVMHAQVPMATLALMHATPAGFTILTT